MNCLLPPEKEVWGKVIFSEASVILFTGGGGLPAEGSSLGGGYIQGRGLHLGGGLPMEGLHPGDKRSLRRGSGPSYLWQEAMKHTTAGTLLKIQSRTVR